MDNHFLTLCLIISIIGVAQGTILGPLLFAIYINDLPDVLLCYNADDTVLSSFCFKVYCGNWELKLNSDLNRVRNWMQINQLKLNIKKSKFMLIGGHSRLNIDWFHYDFYRYLGIVINAWELVIEWSQLNTFTVRSIRNLVFWDGLNLFTSYR